MITKKRKATFREKFFYVSFLGFFCIKTFYLIGCWPISQFNSLNLQKDKYLIAEQLYPLASLIPISNVCKLSASWFKPQMTQLSYLTPSYVFHTPSCYTVNKIITHRKNIICKNIQTNSKIFILNETKMPLTVHFPKYSPSLLTFPFSVLHSKTSPFVFWTTKGSKTTLPFARSLYKLGPFCLSIFKEAKGCISEIKQPNRTAKDTFPYISLYYVIVTRKKKKSTSYWSLSGYEKGPNCIFYDGFKHKIIHVSNVYN